MPDIKNIFENTIVNMETVLNWHGSLPKGQEKIICLGYLHPEEISALCPNQFKQYIIRVNQVGANYIVQAHFGPISASPGSPFRTSLLYQGPNAKVANSFIKKTHQRRMKRGYVLRMYGTKTRLDTYHPNGPKAQIMFSDDLLIDGGQLMTVNGQNIWKSKTIKKNLEASLGDQILKNDFILLELD